MGYRSRKSIIALLAVPAIGVSLYTVSAETRSRRSAVAPIKPAIHLAGARAPDVPILSVWDENFPHDQARDATGDTYDALGFTQDGQVAEYLDDIPDSHTFGTPDETAGANLISGVDIRIVGTYFDAGGEPDTYGLQVNYYSVDSSDLVPAGSVSLTNGIPYTSWRLDVGQPLAVPPGDKIEWTPNPGFTVITARFCVYVDGEMLRCVNQYDYSDANGLAGIGVAVPEEGGDIGGLGVDEFIMYWVIRLATCGDGQLNDGEECDDGNKFACDGCSPTCRLEHPGDLDHDGDVDLFDFSEFTLLFDGPTVP